jgi:hypothetical protein
LDSGFKSNISLKEDVAWRERIRAAVGDGLRRARSTITREMLRNGWQPAADRRAQRLHALPRVACKLVPGNPWGRW